ncbi:O-antigen ligase family protein [Aerococcaceae bacterium zg-BR22]|uniref:O-antigen ligase family protein n=1 Tax=Aerococcaceae bacterium zg-1292 TaxID=2774330 RepID=UPI004062FFA0|nr:O-antigen ligase family protein [Aerococcaceae bacterium zg-BR22]
MNRFGVSNITFFYCLVTMCIILPFYISGPMFIGAVGYLLWQQRKDWATFLYQSQDWWWFILFALVSAIFNFNVKGSLLPIAFFSFTYLVFSYRRQVTLKLYRLLMKIISVSGGITSIHAIWTYWRYIDEHHYGWRYLFTEPNPQFRAESFFFNANYFGLFLVMTILVSVYWLIIATKWWEYVLISCILSLNGIAVLLTASRMLIPTIVVSVFLLVLLIKPKIAWVLLILGLIGLGAILIKPSLFPRFTSLAYGLEDRFMIWQNGWRIFKTRPLTGRGAFAYLNLYYLFTDKADMHSHQLVIDLLANYGLLGVMLLVNALVPFIRSIMHQLRTREGIKEVALVTATLCAVLVHGLMDVSLVWLQTAYVCLMIVSVPLDRFSDGNN